MELIKLSNTVVNGAGY